MQVGKDKKITFIQSLYAGTGWTVEIHPAKEGGYWGEVPAMPGCSSFGATPSECRANVLEAAQGCLEVYFEEAYKAISRRRPIRRAAVHG